VTPTRAPRAAPAQPARTDRAAALLAVAEAAADPVLLGFLLEAAAVVVAAADVVTPAGVDCVARGAVDCPEIWERMSAEKTPVILSRLFPTLDNAFK